MKSYLKNEIFKLIREAQLQPNIQFNYVDPVDNVSYCVTADENKLTVSVVNWDPCRMQVCIPFSPIVYGEPDKIFTKPWYRDERFMYLVMYWEGNWGISIFH